MKKRSTFFERRSIRKEANILFGSKKQGRQWMREKVMALGGQKPKDVIKTKEGAQQVRDLLGRIEYGVYS